jgi:hypothetical protein
VKSSHGPARGHIGLRLTDLERELLDALIADVQATAGAFAQVTASALVKGLLVQEAKRRGIAITDNRLVTDEPRKPTLSEQMDQVERKLDAPSTRVPPTHSTASMTPDGRVAVVDTAAEPDLRYLCVYFGGRISPEDIDDVDEGDEVDEG